MSGSTLAPDLVNGAVEMLMRDSVEYQKMDFANCLIDLGAVCFVDGAGVIDDSVMVAALQERGWVNPTKWDCFSPKTGKVIENPFDS